MTQPTAPLASPKDNLTGTCHAIATDFGFNPLWLRLAFAFALLFNLELVLAAYVALALLVASSRLLFPARRTATVTPLPVAERAMPAMELRQAA